MVISVCNEKGGSGKTTIALNLAVKLGLLKEDTLLIDADPQRSIEVFTNIRANENINQLKDLNYWFELKEKGAITQDEYEIKKKSFLS